MFRLVTHNHNVYITDNDGNVLALFRRNNSTIIPENWRIDHFRKLSRNKRLTKVTVTLRDSVTVGRNGGLMFHNGLPQYATVINKNGVMETDVTDSVIVSNYIEDSLENRRALQNAIS